MEIDETKYYVKPTAIEQYFGGAHQEMPSLEVSPLITRKWEKTRFAYVYDWWKYADSAGAVKQGLDAMDTWLHFHMPMGPQLLWRRMNAYASRIVHHVRDEVVNSEECIFQSLFQLSVDAHMMVHQQLEAKALPLLEATRELRDRMLKEYQSVHALVETAKADDVDLWRDILAARMRKAEPRLGDGDMWKYVEWLEKEFVGHFYKTRYRVDETRKQAHDFAEKLKEEYKGFGQCPARETIALLHDIRELCIIVLVLLDEVERSCKGE